MFRAPAFLELEHDDKGMVQPTGLRRSHTYMQYKAWAQLVRRRSINQSINQSINNSDRSLPGPMDDHRHPKRVDNLPYPSSVHCTKTTSHRRWWECTSTGTEEIADGG